MKYEKAISIKCPMCKYVNIVSAGVLRERLHVHEGAPFIFLCDTEKGGCDRYFVTEIHLVPHVRTYAYTEYVTAVPE